jgi:hypothetical protein
MATSGHANDEFIHQLAIKLSRALNIVNPNDLLAQRVVDIAKTNSLDDFTKGFASILIDTLSLPLTIYSSGKGVWKV